MHKILLVIDDYKELVATENLLRRLGFDVLSVGKEILVNDALLRFHPQAVLATFKGRAVDGLKLAARLKKLNPAPKVALAVNGAPVSQAAAGVDAWILFPANPEAVIRLIARLVNEDPTPLLGKYHKLMPKAQGLPGSAVTPSSLGEASGADVTGKPIQQEERENLQQEDWDPVKHPGRAGAIRTARSKKYDDFLEQHRSEDGKVDQVLPSELMAKEAAKIQPESSDEKEWLQGLGILKRAFVGAMFERQSRKPSADGDLGRPNESSENQARDSAPSQFSSGSIKPKA